MVPLKTVPPPRCAVCSTRVAPWLVKLIDKPDPAPVCGWCFLYSMKTEWGVANKDELVYAGKAVEAMAARANRPLPVLDVRGRLSTVDAEKYVAGIFATSMTMNGVFGRLSKLRGR